MITSGSFPPLKASARSMSRVRLHRLDRLALDIDHAEAYLFATCKRPGGDRIDAADGCPFETSAVAADSDSRSLGLTAVAATDAVVGDGDQKKVHSTAGGEIWQNTR
jgi:hypothetical protein